VVAPPLAQTGRTAACEVARVVAATGSWCLLSNRRTPDVLPVLSRGKHRNPRKGACFMELASYLAGERWSDHPKCTHPLLAALAREVNDSVDDATRRRLAPLIPDVIGLDTDDPRADAWIARTAALAALPVVAAEKQDITAVGLYSCERHLARLERRPLDDLTPEVRVALDQVPHARDWARGFTATGWGPAGQFDRRSASVIVHTAVAGLAAACVSDAADRLVDLLTETIGECRERFATRTTEVTEEQWRAVHALTVR
jgi:hypothetical protein